MKRQLRYDFIALIAILGIAYGVCKGPSDDATGGDDDDSSAMESDDDSGAESDDDSSAR